MINKPEKITKRIIKAVGSGQAVLIIGNWSEELIKGIKEKQNAITFCSDSYLSLEFQSLPENSFTRIIADYSSPIFEKIHPDPQPQSKHFFFTDIRRLLLPSGLVIISANCIEGIVDKIFNLFKTSQRCSNIDTKKIKPKVLQDQIHDNGFLIDGYYGYPGGDLLMMAQIQNKNVSTLFTSERQETVLNKTEI